MIWKLSILLSIGVLAATLLLLMITVRHTNNRTITKPLPVFMAGTFLSSVFLFYPICQSGNGNALGSVPISILESIHSSIKLFVVDSDFGMVRDQVEHLSEGLRSLYHIWGAILITLCPVSTFGVVLSFFKSALCYQQYLLHCHPA